MPYISDGDSEAVLVVSKRSPVPKEWKFPSECQVQNSIIEACGSEILAKLLVKRGLRTPDEVAAYLDPSHVTPSSPAALPDMPRAVARVMQAIAGREKITVFGDYDVDGVTATAVMVTTLRHLGAEVDYYIPTRAEGYGLNLKAISVLASKHRTKLIITCDCGISNFAEINFAKSLGVDTVVVDHHTMPDMLPPAAAILHPKQLAEDHPIYHLPGVGVAFKLAEALLIERGEPERAEELLDLVTLGMIADMVPLVKECRYLVQIGMPKLVNSQRAGIQALLGQVGGRDGGTDLVGFGLAPRINAVGRLSDANTAVQLMITQDAAEAAELARKLEYDNLRRQELCEEIFAKADQAAQANISAGDKAIAIYSEGWHHGVVGIVASRLVERYHCPVFIGELDANEGIVKGSARGIDGIDLYEVLKANEHLALKWGGHKMAAGFSVEVAKADLFCKGIVETCNRHLADRPLVPTLEIDLVAPASEVTMQLAELLQTMAPFGIGNRKPVIAMRGLKCAGSRPLGKEGKHSRIVAKADSGEQFESVYWSSHGRVPADGQVIDLAFAPDINTYNGVSRLQLVLADWRDPNQPVVPQAVHKPSGQVAQVQAPLPGPKMPAHGNRVAPTGNPAAAAVPNSGLSPAATNAGAESGRTPAGTEERGLKPAGTNGKQATPKPGEVIDVSPERAIAIKDLRNHSAPESVLQAAIRKLGTSINLFGEGCPAISGATFVDRTAAQPSAHLLLWQYPPALPVLKGLVQRCSATNLYLVGGAPQTMGDTSAFLKKLMGLVRFAVNQREGQADPERMAAAMSGTKMTIALGLTILKKINLIDWFAEDGMINLDILDQPSGKPEELPDFRQLGNCLKEIGEFRTWCHTASISEIQLALVPAAPSSQQPLVREGGSLAGGQENTESNFSGTYQYDTASEPSSNFT
jgi:single-stranded-DNA-specific exonuclease RecJ